MNDDDDRCYIDPLRCIYVDEDGAVHFVAPRIAELFEISLDDAIKVVRKLAAEEGVELETLYEPLPKRATK